ncbi:MAG: DUF1045 domain-containing protein, partial [Deltaproteobacteria bacterium]|nr:DUF1045 domain-containing protein [Deltaproteobacteria bacterium]
MPKQPGNPTKQPAGLAKIWPGPAQAAKNGVMIMTERFSVYHVPNPLSRLYSIGSAILGRCVHTGERLQPPWSRFHGPDVPQGVPKASTYGFHATMVAPFRSLAKAETLAETLEALCDKTEPIKLGPLELSLLEPGFPALIPKSFPKELNDLEERLVKAFARFSHPIEPADLARREPLTP